MIHIEGSQMGDVLLEAAHPPLPTSVFSLSTTLSVVAVLVGITIFAFGIATAFKYREWHTSPWFSDRYYASSHIWDWMDALTSKFRLTPHNTLQSVDMPLDKPIAPVTESISERTTDVTQATSTSLASMTKHIDESWCFVGEDLSGRYCVKVPSAASCEPNRLFGSKSDCELQQGQHLPAGVITETGTLSLLSGTH